MTGRMIGIRVLFANAVVVILIGFSKLPRKALGRVRDIDSEVALGRL